jgi:two-component system sensor histidine kinase KdpD
MIKIMDRGSGIPESELPYIFEKFYRATNVNQFQGTGLGLSICAGIIEAHKGTIHASNRPDGGTVFEICLPISEGT